MPTERSRPAATSSIYKLQVAFGEAMDTTSNVGRLGALDFVREMNNLLWRQHGQQGRSQRNNHSPYWIISGSGIIGKAEEEEPLAEEAEELIRKREEARKAKDWKAADK